MQHIAITFVTQQGKMYQRSIKRSGSDPVIVSLPPGSQLSVKLMGTPDKAPVKHPGAAILNSKRKGHDLIVEADDQEVLVVSQFYQSEGASLGELIWEPQAAVAPSVKTATTADAEEKLQQGQESLSPQPSVSANPDPVQAPQGGVNTASGVSWGSVVLGGLAIGAAAGGAGGGGGSNDSNSASTVVRGTITAGPVTGNKTLLITLYKSDGTTVLGSAQIDPGGEFSVTVNQYTGLVIAKVTSPGTGPDYTDEATGAGIELPDDAPLLAITSVGTGSATVHVNPLTTLAAQKVGLGSKGEVPTGTSITTSQVATVNAAIAKSLGLSGDVTKLAVTPSVKPDGSAQTPNEVGAVLAAISGLAAGKSQKQVYEQLKGLLDSSGGLNDEGLSQLLQGAQVAGVDAPLRGQLAKGQNAAGFGIDDVQGLLNTLSITNGKITGTMPQGTDVSKFVMQFVGAVDPEKTTKANGTGSFAQLTATTWAYSPSQADLDFLKGGATNGKDGPERIELLLSGQRKAVNHVFYDNGTDDPAALTLVEWVKTSLPESAFDDPKVTKIKVADVLIQDPDGGSSSKPALTGTQTTWFDLIEVTPSQPGGNPKSRRYELFLKSLSYDDATTLSVGVELGSGSSKVTQTYKLSITDVNYAPVAKVANVDLGTSTEDSATPTVSDVKTLFGGNTVYSNNDHDAKDSLAGIAITANAAHKAQGLWQYSTDQGGSWITISNTGLSDAAALFLNADCLLRFMPAANFNGAPGALTVRLVDDSIKTQLVNASTLNVSGFGGNSAFSQGTVTLSTQVTTVNDAPVATGSATLDAIKEDAGLLAGATVAKLFASNFSDSADSVTGGSAANTLAGVAITANAAQSTQGTWQYSSDKGQTWKDISTTGLTEAAALFLSADTLVRFSPSANYNGTPGNLTLRLVESSSNSLTNATPIDVSSNGGKSAFSVATVSLGTHVQAVNDAPVVTNPSTLPSATVGITADAGLRVDDVFKGNFSDSADAVSGGSVANTLAGVAIVGNAATAAQGTWQYSIDGSNWVNVTTSGLSDKAALYCNVDTKFRFHAATGFNDAPGELTVRLVESGATGLRNATVINVSANGGSSPYSSETVSLGTGPKIRLLQDTGFSSTDGVTQKGTVVVDRLQSGQPWEYSTDNGQTWNTGSNDRFELTKDDSYRLLVKQSGFTTPNPLQVTLDTAVDTSAQTITAGLYAEDTLTNSNSLQYTTIGACLNNDLVKLWVVGQSEPFAKVTGVFAGRSFTADADANGSWKHNLTASDVLRAGVGNETFYMTQVQDLAGNVQSFQSTDVTGSVDFRTTARTKSNAETGYGKGTYVDAMINGGVGWNGTEITYAFDTTGVVWTDVEKAAFRSNLQAYSNVCLLKFTELAWDDTVNFGANWKLTKFSEGPNDKGVIKLGSFEFPAYLDEHAGSFKGQFNEAYDGWKYFTAGSFAANLLIHETGHALGLAHPFHGTPTFPGVPFDPSSPWTAYGDYGLNDSVWTVMSYSSGWQYADMTSSWNNDPSTFSYGSSYSPMFFDIAALQTLYGKNTTYRNGSDVYTLPTAAVAGTGWSCLWDTGGEDTITNEGSSLSCVINLNAYPLQGGQNSVPFVSRAMDANNKNIPGGFTVADGAIIENATGGTGADTLTGNAVANRLAGGLGNDTLTGGAGADRFVFDTAPNRLTNMDTLLDFSIPDGDTLVLSQKVFTALTVGAGLQTGQLRTGAGVVSAADANDFIVYNTTTGALYYDPDGSGTAAALQFALLSNKPTLAAWQFVVI